MPKLTYLLLFKKGTDIILSTRGGVIIVNEIKSEEYIANLYNFVTQHKGNPDMLQAGALALIAEQMRIQNLLKAHELGFTINVNDLVRSLGANPANQRNLG